MPDVPDFMDRKMSKRSWESAVGKWRRVLREIARTLGEGIGKAKADNMGATACGFVE